MQALLIPLRLTHVANDALIKSLKDTALALPRPPGCSWRLKSVAGSTPRTSPTLPTLTQLQEQPHGVLSASLRVGTFGFKNGLGGQEEGSTFGLRAAGPQVSPCGQRGEGECGVAASGLAGTLA